MNDVISLSNCSRQFLDACKSGCCWSRIELTVRTAVDAEQLGKFSVQTTYANFRADDFVMALSAEPILDSQWLPPKGYARIVAGVQGAQSNMLRSLAQT